MLTPFCFASVSTLNSEIRLCKLGPWQIRLFNPPFNNVFVFRRTHLIKPMKSIQEQVREVLVRIFVCYIGVPTYHFWHERWSQMGALQAGRVLKGTKRLSPFRTSIVTESSQSIHKMTTIWYLQGWEHLSFILPIKKTVLILHRDEWREIVRDSIICHRPFSNRSDVKNVDILCIAWTRRWKLFDCLVAYL